MDYQIGLYGTHSHRINNGHLFYCFTELEKYIQIAVSYIVSGVRQGDHVLLVENDRINLMISHQLKKVLTQEQLSNLHFINNFHFYWRNGNFHPTTILSFFTRFLDPGRTNNWSYRTWGHVEWGNQEDLFRNIEQFEAAVGGLLPEKPALAVCAYDDQRLPDHLREKLRHIHGCLLTDDDMYSFSAPI